MQAKQVFLEEQRLALAEMKVNLSPNLNPKAGFFSFPNLDPKH